VLTAVVDPCRRPEIKGCKSPALGSGPTNWHNHAGCAENLHLPCSVLRGSSVAAGPATARSLRNTATNGDSNKTRNRPPADLEDAETRGVCAGFAEAMDWSGPLSLAVTSACARESAEAGQSQPDAGAAASAVPAAVGKPCLCLDKTALGGEWFRTAWARTMGTGVVSAGFGRRLRPDGKRGGHQSEGCRRLGKK